MCPLLRVNGYFIILFAFPAETDKSLGLQHLVLQDKGTLAELPVEREASIVG